MSYHLIEIFPDCSDVVPGNEKVGIHPFGTLLVMRKIEERSLFPDPFKQLRGKYGREVQIRTVYGVTIRST
jgi:hypothetical protein